MIGQNHLFLLLRSNSSVAATGIDPHVVLSPDYRQTTAASAPGNVTVASFTETNVVSNKR
jgi:hypothetical protein